MSFKNKLKKTFKKSIRNLKLVHMRRHFFKDYKSSMKKLGYDPHKKAVGEENYLTVWKPITKHVNKYAYRYFCNYFRKNTGGGTYIVSGDIGHSYIEEYLNPPRLRAFYSDKNLFEQYLDDSILPKTYLRRIGGSCLLNKNYEPANLTYILGEIPKDRSLILKPSIDSNSGKGVMLFEFNNGEWYAKQEKQVLNADFLIAYGRDFILQDCLNQHSYISQFCSTSINTLRLCVYRSVKDESINVTAAIMRIGKSGSITDNAHSGGVFIGISLKDGTLDEYVCDQYGNVKNVWNGIDFKTNRYVIPNWAQIINFAKYIGRQNHHCRLLALDICLDPNGEPKLIEYNVNVFSYWLFNFTGQIPLGAFSQEIIDYVVNENSKR